MHSGTGQFENGKYLIKNASVEGLQSKSNLKKQTSSQLKAFDHSPQFYAGAQPSLFLPNYGTEAVDQQKSAANVAPLLSPLQSSRAVMATKLQPVKISQDIFNNTAPERGAGP